MKDVSSRKSRVALLSVVSNATLVALKLIVGIAVGSVSVISEAIHSGVDLIAAVIALFAVKTSGRPADREHPYGHGKIENISGTVEALLIFVAALWIIREAIEKLKHPQSLESVGWGVGVMLLSAVANQIVSTMLFRVGKETDSVALLADAWHLRTDVYTSIGVFAGLGIIMLAKKLFPAVDLHWVDPVAAIAVAILILRAAYHLTLESARDLLDISLPTEEEEWIHKHVEQHMPPVKAFHRLRTRKGGSRRFVDFHLLVSPDMSVSDSHALADDITVGIKDHFADCVVTIHVEPIQNESTAKETITLDTKKLE